MDQRLGRASVYGGVVGPVVFMVLYTIAAVGDPEYVFFRNYLSDLGVGSHGAFFNSACMIAGALTIPFALFGIRPALDGGIAANAAVSLTVIAGVFLIMVGVFTEESPDMHTIASYGFFLSMLAALFCYSFTLHYSGSLDRFVGELTKAVFGLGVLLVVLGGFCPETETVAVLAIVVWGLVVAVTLLRRGAEADTY